MSELSDDEYPDNVDKKVQINNFFDEPPSINYTRPKIKDLSYKKKTQKNKKPNTLLNEVPDTNVGPSIKLEKVRTMRRIKRDGSEYYISVPTETASGNLYIGKRYISYDGNNLPLAVRKHNGDKKVKVQRFSDDENSSDSDDGRTTNDSFSQSSDIYYNNDDSDSDSDNESDKEILNKLIEEDEDAQLMEKLMNEPDNDEPDNDGPDDESTQIKDEDLKKILYDRHSAWGGKQTRRRSVHGKRDTRAKNPRSRRVTRSRSKKRPTGRRRSCRQRK
jgi:hypothetical protein